MKGLKLAIILIGYLLATPVIASETTTDFVVRTLFVSQQLTSSSSDNKLVKAAQGDAASFVATDGNIRGAHLEAALQKIRKAHPTLKATDLELAKVILAQEDSI